MQTLHSKLTEIAQRFPAQPIMQIKEDEKYKQYTYQDIYKTAQNIAQMLIQLGIHKGDKVAIILNNRPEWGIIYFGILYAGAIAIPLDPQAHPTELEYCLNDSDAKLAFTSKELNIKTQVKTLFVEELSEEIEHKAKLPKVSQQELASILYTSGTTGKPKGVMLRHNNFYSNFQSLEPLKLASEKDNVLSILPLHHSFPFMFTLIIPLFSRSMITYVKTLRSEELLSTMQETGVTALVAVPGFFNLLHEQIDKRLNQIIWPLRILLKSMIALFALIRNLTKLNLNKFLLHKIHRMFGKQLKYLGCGGAKLDPEITRFFETLGFTMLEGYGLTETSPLVTCNYPKCRKIGSVGRAIAGVNVIIDAPDKAGIGEILISGPNVMKGYYKHPELTREVITDGWFHSGDLGYFDRKGFLFITGRKKEIIILSSGKNINPEEVENYYLQTPFIKELCVLAIKDHLKAIVVPNLEHFKKMGTVSIYDTIKWELDNLSKQYPAYKRIMGFTITRENLPRTRLGKLKRFEIENLYQSSEQKTEYHEKTSISPDDATLLASDIGQTTLAVLTNHAATDKTIGLYDHLEMDLGLDSLKRIELMVDLEKQFQVHIPDTEMAQLFTVKEIILEIQHRQGKIADAPQKTTSWKQILTHNPKENIQKMIEFTTPKIVQWFINIFCFLLWMLCKLLWRTRITGINNIPKEGNIILCANHNSYLDSFLVWIALPAWLRTQTFFLGYRLFFTSRLARAISQKFRIVPIDQAIQLIDAMQASAYILKRKQSICIFPAGARSFDGKVQPFRKGVGILAKELNVKLLPIYLEGTFEAWPRTRRFPKLHPIAIHFGTPSTPEELLKKGEQLGAKDEYEAIAMGIREKIISLGEQSR